MGGERWEGVAGVALLARLFLEPQRVSVDVGFL